MDKRVHDPTRNVDRPPRRREREGSRELARDVDRDRRVEALVDETIEESFPASDPPSWTVGSSVVVEEERRRAACESAAAARAADEPEPARESRASKRADARLSMDEHGRRRPASDDEDTLDLTRDPNERARAARVEQQPERANLTPAGANVAPEGAKVAPEHAHERAEEETDLPGRRNTTEGPHQAFPGAPKVSPPKPISR